jgi:signal transduction histidine kinase
MREAERRRIEAEESKRQHELLVDVTSHEIRTPVSAILHSSSFVRENLAELKETFRNGSKPSEQALRRLDEDLEALDSESFDDELC